LIFRSTPGTKFTAEVLVHELKALLTLESDPDTKYTFPLLTEYRKTFEPGIFDITKKCDAAKAAAGKGDLYARLLYAGCFLNGFGRPESIDQALKHYQLASEGGSPEGQVFTFMLLQQSVNPDPDLKPPLHYLDLAVKQGYALAQWMRGLEHILNNELQAAVSLFKQSADQGKAFGELSYGICLLFGYGTERDEGKGVEYLTRIKKHEWPFALFFAGLVLHSADLHPNTATEYFEFAAKKEIHVAQAYYAWALENGFGVEKNRKRAAEFYKKAVAAGYGLARDGLRRCTESESL
jgi:TPR repeat protein